MSDSTPPSSGAQAACSTVELVGRAQQGETAAREELFARYAPRVLAIARARLGVRLRGVLESGDILQETLLEALRGLERFEMRDESSLIRWLAQLVEHRITARASYHAAAKRSAPEVSQHAGDGASAPLVSGTPGEPAGGSAGPLTEFTQRETSAAVQVALAGLSERQRELVLLRDYAGASWEEVAAATGAPTPAAARMLHARALVTLGALLRAHGD
jgi:RNA polymerase sigma-70 factor (ECF subfamily)